MNARGDRSLIAHVCACIVVARDRMACETRALITEPYNLYDSDIQQWDINDPETCKNCMFLHNSQDSKQGNLTFLLLYINLFLLHIMKLLNDSEAVVCHLSLEIKSSFLSQSVMHMPV